MVDLGEPGRSGSFGAYRCSEVAACSDYQQRVSHDHLQKRPKELEGVELGLGFDLDLASDRVVAASAVRLASALVAAAVADKRLVAHTPP